MKPNSADPPEELLRRKRREWPQCHKESSWQVGQSRLCQNEKERSRLSETRDREVGESTVSEQESARHVFANLPCFCI